jgi:hypothetical protein
MLGQPPLFWTNPEARFFSEVMHFIWNVDASTLRKESAQAPLNRQFGSGASTRRLVALQRERPLDWKPQSPSSLSHPRMRSATACQPDSSIMA